MSMTLKNKNSKDSWKTGGVGARPVPTATDMLDESMDGVSLASATSSEVPPPVEDSNNTHGTEAMTASMAQNKGRSMDSSWGELSGSVKGDDDEMEKHKLDAEVKGLVQKETQAVHLLRVVVILVLLAAAVATASIVYRTFKDKEYDAFLEEYKAVSTRIIDLYRNDILQKLWVAQNLANTFTAMIQAQAMLAPNITIPSFHKLVEPAVKLAPVGTVKWSPLLFDVQDAYHFQAHAAEHYNHSDSHSSDEDHDESEDEGEHEEEHAAEAESEDQDLDDHDNDSTRKRLQRRRLARVSDISQLNSSTYTLTSPVWQAAPSFGKGHNARFYNLMDNPIFRDAILAMIETKGPVMSRVYELGPLTKQDSDSEDEGGDKSDSDSEDGEASSEEQHGEESSEEQHDEGEESSEEAEEQNDQDGGRRLRRLDSSSDSDSSDEDAGDGMERAMTLFFPVFDDEVAQTNVVGSVSLELVWSDYLSGYLLVEGGEELNYEENVFDTDEVDAILENTCGQVFTTSIDESSIKFVTEGDIHDVNFDHLNWGTSFEEFAYDLTSFGQAAQKEGRFDLNKASTTQQGQQCFYRLILYPNQELVDEHLTNEALLFSFAVAFIFMFTSSIFIAYDCIVSRRQNIITKRAMRTNAIVANLFPAGVRDRLIGSDVTIPNHGGGHRKPGRRLAHSSSKNKKQQVPIESDPIADLFPECTCIFADIAGFTAWSSEREPPQVFKLLERIFADFDYSAKKLGVFKVETIGDCYVAVVGLPTPRADHACVGAMFARAIVRQMKISLKDLEKTLGPSTADLDIRVGIHSGPVTAGVLRGEKSRFQLFGDTMNVASRMENTGKAGMIHASGACADRLEEAGLGEWLVVREDTPEIKGKGIMKTFWLKTREGGSATTSSVAAEDEAVEDLGISTTDLSFPDRARSRRGKALSAKVQRLVEWNVHLLSSILRQVVARRSSDRMNAATMVKSRLSEHSGPMLDEVKEILALPQFDAKAARNQVNPASVVLPDVVVSQLTSFVEKIAATYHDNPFHCFEHAAHVTMSVQKLLTRIVRPTDMLSETGKQAKTAVQLHDHTFGITSDPLTQLAVVLSALIHDAGHPGVANTVLVKEGDPMAVKYNDKSVAEQNSVDLAFGLLDLPEYVDLRKCIYSTEDEFNRFRSTIINLVLATDIMDKELGALRKDRWSKAFSKDAESLLDGAGDGDEDNHTVVNRKATIVLEHLIQASDVAHTMQHWHVFQKWNEKLFNEMYGAYKEGRIETDPSVGWYKGEIGFFDFYIIPLAKKLETCGIFGVSSHEYLSYAEANRHEWVVKGEEIVKGYIAKYSGSGSGGDRDETTMSGDDPTIANSVDC